MKNIISFISKIFIPDLKNEYVVKEYNCQCGKKIKIYLYNNSGYGECECGAKIIIN